MKIKLKWVAEAQGEDVIDLEDFDITPEIWDDMTERDKLEVLQEYTNNENYDAVAYGIVTSFSKMED